MDGSVNDQLSKHEEEIVIYILHFDALANNEERVSVREGFNLKKKN